MRVLEPSFGDGAFILPLLRSARSSNTPASPAERLVKGAGAQHLRRGIGRQVVPPLPAAASKPNSASCRRITISLAVIFSGMSFRETGNGATADWTIG